MDSAEKRVAELEAEVERLRSAPWPGQGNVVLEAYRAANVDPHCEVPHEDMAELIDRAVRENDRLRAAMDTADRALAYCDEPPRLVAAARSQIRAALRRPEEEQPGAHTTDEALAPTASRAGGSSHANPDHRTTSPEAVGSERLTSVPPAASAPREDAGTLERAAEILDDGLPSSEVLVDELRSRSRGLRSAPLASPAGGEARQAAQEKIEFRTGSEWEDVDGADGSAPIVPSAPPPATGDVFERAAMDWYGGTLDLRARNLSKFLSARFGPAVAALEMIAKHPCGASVQPMKKPDEEPYHCGECAWCVAKDALSELRAAGAAKGASSNG
jgi:hypothetical protein